MRKLQDLLNSIPWKTHKEVRANIDAHQAEIVKLKLEPGEYKRALRDAQDMIDALRAEAARLKEENARLKQDVLAEHVEAWDVDKGGPSLEKRIKAFTDGAKASRRGRF